MTPIEENFIAANASNTEIYKTGKYAADKLVPPTLTAYSGFRCLNAINSAAQRPLVVAMGVKLETYNVSVWIGMRNIHGKRTYKFLRGLQRRLLA